ncbi:hypothetical protein HGQ77_13105 [Staphylococcus aureus]|nr:hypothetical protein [Staphylococcus aureus]
MSASLYIAIILVIAIIAYMIVQQILNKRAVKELDQNEFHNGIRKAQVIDVREKVDYDYGHINGSRNIPMTMFRQRFQGLLEGFKNLGFDTYFAVPKTPEERQKLKQPRSSVCFDAPSWYELVVEGRKIAAIGLVMNLDAFIFSIVRMLISFAVIAGIIYLIYYFFILTEDQRKYRKAMRKYKRNQRRK